VRSERTHTYDRYFQLGPGIQISGQGPRALDLRAPGLTGALYSESSTGPEKRTPRRGSRRPLSGWTSPSYRAFVPRWTIDLRSVAKDASYATTISLNSEELRAVMRSTGPSSTTLNLLSHGAVAGTLTVERNGSNLVVAQSP
jgi:hypothetical protein